jgi:trimethylamine:corrinoid methyltransferase-like protein
MLHIDVSAVDIPYDLLSKEEIEEINRQVILLMNKFGIQGAKDTA